MVLDGAIRTCYNFACVQEDAGLFKVHSKRNGMFSNSVSKYPVIAMGSPRCMFRSLGSKDLGNHLAMILNLPACSWNCKNKEERMNSKIITAALLLLSSPAFAAGVCIVCPPGYDCSTGTPVANTGNARLATIGDIPTTAAQVGAVPATRSIAGLELSGDITLEQLRDVLDTCNLPISGTAGSGTIESKCSTTNGTVGVAGNPSGGYGEYCWCRYSKNDLKKVLSGESCGDSRYTPWVFYTNVSDTIYDRICSKDCATYCTSNSAWRAASVW